MLVPSTIVPASATGSASASASVSGSLRCFDARSMYRSDSFILILEIYTVTTTSTSRPALARQCVAKRRVMGSVYLGSEPSSRTYYEP